MSAGVVRCIERYMASGEWAGAAVVVMRGDTIVLEHYAGAAAPGVPAAAGVLWPLASISKVYAAATIMRLVEMGELTLNTLAGSIFPEFASNGRAEVRIRHLLTHTAGMPYESPQMAELLRLQTPLAEMLQDALVAPQLFAPGSRLSYSDYHWLVLAEIARRVTGQEFATLMHDLVLQPMGLTQTVFPIGGATPVAYVRGALAEGTEGSMYNSAYGRSLAHPAFGVAASARDVAQFARHFAPGGPRVLCEATVRAMTSDQTAGVPGSYPVVTGLGDAPRHAWGIGWALQTASTPALFSELASFQSFGHHGASGCQVIVDPAQDLVLVTLTNTHLNTGIARWYDRLQALAACAVVSAHAHTA